MKLPVIAGSFLLSCGILFIINQQAKLSDQKAPDASFTGRITLRGEPISDAEVQLRPAPFHQLSALIASVKTDEDGRYRIWDVQPGRYIVCVKAPGLITEERSNGAAGREIGLVAGEIREKIDFNMMREGVIAGRATEESGKPLVRQPISIVNASASTRFPFLENFEMMLTDDHGIYRIDGLPPGRYKVGIGYGIGSRVSAPENNMGYYPLTYHPNVRDESKAGTVEVVEGGEVSGIDIVVSGLLRTYEATGRIVNAETGQPQSGIKWGYDGGSASTFGKLSDENGEFRITGLMPGSYSVFAGCEGDFYSTKLQFEINDRNVAGLEVRRTPGASIRGKVVVEGAKISTEMSNVNQVTITARWSGTGFVNSLIESDGSFYFCGLPPGRHKIEVNSLRRSGYWLSRVERNGSDIGETVEVSAGDRLTDVRVVLAKGSGSIRGQVSFGDYVLPAGVHFRVQAHRVGETDFSRQLLVEPDDKGRFVINGLIPGEYILRRGGFYFTRPGMVSPKTAPLEERVTVTNGAESTVNLVFKVLP